ncbi:HD-GYP domain-containing protein [Aneurinibacillus sp. REN35]|uniref:HD-GYP domain-containing protein n=1 Tax=Aneurinibacillus sp. REN35 TaxID=3237286 RepID=UPI0035284398
MIDNLIGKIVKEDIVAYNGVCLLKKGTLLQKDHVTLLVRNRIFLRQEDTINQEESIIREATEQMKEIFEFTRDSNQVPLQEIEDVMAPTVQQLASNHDIFSLLSHLLEKDDYTYRHNIGVAVLSAMIGTWTNLTGEQLSSLTVAALLHDIGKVRISEEILNKPGKLTDEEYACIKRHAVYGYEILQNTKAAPDIYAIVALQHHEREDGTGYPHRLPSAQIDFFSKIVAIADVFHAMTSKRVYREAIPFYEVMNEMHKERFGKLHPELLHVFIHRMMLSLLGRPVLLSDGREGIVRFIHPSHPTLPIIESGSEYIDLHKDPFIQIQKIILE